MSWPSATNFLAFRNIGGSRLFFHKDRLYLHSARQIGRLEGDWGHNGCARAAASLAHLLFDTPKKD